MKTNELLANLNNRDKISRLTKDVKEQILEGEINPLDAAMIIKGMEDFTKNLRGDALVQDAIIEEVQKFGKTAEYKGAKFTVKEVGVSYDFSYCHDPKWDLIKARIDELSELLKEREAFLKSIRGQETLVDEESGEVYTVNPPVKRSKTGYMVSL